MLVPLIFTLAAEGSLRLLYMRHAPRGEATLDNFAELPPLWRSLPWLLALLRVPMA